MRLRSLGGNANELEVDGVTILFSYATPVAAHVPGAGFFRTSERYSSTTSKHINGWLKSQNARHIVEASQEAIGGLLSRTKGEA